MYGLAVAIFAMIRSANKSFLPSTVIIEQYRPPIDKFIIELPAGLIDENETPEQAAIRELEEETGFKADEVIESSPVVVCDPGMTSANMKLVVLGVTFPGKLELRDAKLDDGEHIVKRIVELTKLYDELREYDKKVLYSVIYGVSSGINFLRRELSYRASLSMPGYHISLPDSTSRNK
ncbi:hypothetical protein EW145_g2181 [Phellinidium pouzarii]|uniref:Nudix hydrolase domain-containing protein n=1 Tax=Phellinidium pouzarii TaxID=167371 RepID=A0A4S4LCD8_9AGAM|nr:hypothetical protein EW145_g2181 [Phellinidium pouzarii]